MVTTTKNIINLISIVQRKSLPMIHHDGFSVMTMMMIQHIDRMNCISSNQIIERGWGGKRDWMKGKEQTKMVLRYIIKEMLDRTVISLI